MNQITIEEYKNGNILRKYIAEIYCGNLELQILRFIVEPQTILMGQRKVKRNKNPDSTPDTNLVNGTDFHLSHFLHLPVK